MVEFDITGKERKRMKAFFRRHGVDFFAKTSETNEILNNIAPCVDFVYQKVSFLIPCYNIHSDFSHKRRLLSSECQGRSV